MMAFAGSAVASFIFYFRHRDNSDLTRIQIYSLATLRSISFFLIALLLLSPLLKTLRKIVQKPSVVFAIDNSLSIRNQKDSTNVISELKEISELLKNKTRDQFNVVTYTFGEKSSKEGIINLTEKKSDYSEIINTVYNNHFNENIGALVIAGDGIYNRGENPLNATLKFGFPVYTIGMGDTTLVRDARIANLLVNKTAFSGNYFPVEIDFRFLKLMGTPLQFSILREGEKVYSEQLVPANDDFFKALTVNLEAKESGLQHYLVEISESPGERNVKNNSVPFAINVLNNKQKIIIISNGPHPDAGAIKNVLENRQNYDVSVITGEPFPDDFRGNNLVILNQIPGTGLAASDLLKRVSDSGVPILFLIGSSSFLPQFNQLETGIKILPQAGAMDESQAAINPLFVTYSLSNEVIEGIPGFPPLLSPFAEYETDPALSIVLYQVVKNIPTSRPLIAAGNISGKKTGIIAGEGIWKWRLYDYNQHNSHNIFEEFINQLIQYLALKENEDNFNVYFQPVYTETDEIVFNAELYNDAFELVTDPEVNMSVVRPDSTEINLTFDKLEQTYRMNAGTLPAGDYSFSAKTELGSSTYYEAGNFAVIPVNSESSVNEANHKMLYQLSAQTGGKYYSIDQAEQLVNDLEINSNIKPVNYYQADATEALNFRILCLVIVILMGSEWFLRKFWGIY